MIIFTQKCKYYGFKKKIRYILFENFYTGHGIVCIYYYFFYQFRVLYLKHNHYKDGKYTFLLVEFRDFRMEDK